MICIMSTYKTKVCRLEDAAFPFSLLFRVERVIVGRWGGHFWKYLWNSCHSSGCSKCSSIFNWCIYSEREEMYNVFNEVGIYSRQKFAENISILLIFSYRHAYIYTHTHLSLFQGNHKVLKMLTSLALLNWRDLQMLTSLEELEKNNKVMKERERERERERGGEAN